ncbi:hypothetical protein H206_05327 [Candidatus Electrothrix aarhusensis]|uniref:Uncharacterized protein n=1 Tax=Candidatus Electrothrix aarhusensis TaxID=1859131 RepID=A0A3S3RU70_9BACT|nr:hypothetical protein H206_05327 [Candidatus Electrothrix aarhusensis]
MAFIGFDSADLASDGLAFTGLAFVGFDSASFGSTDLASAVLTPAAFI